MTLERMESKDRRLLFVVALVIAASVSYTVHNYRAAFPQASLDLRYSRDEITRQAEQFLASRGLSPDGFRNLTLFDPDENARLYLERELGLEDANRLMREAVSVWRWRARWFRPPEKEERIVYLSTQGRLVGFEHLIPEAEPGARLEQTAARRVAEQFLRAQSGEKHRLIEEQVQERPARHDHVFTWEQEGFLVKEATCRRTVVVQGDQVGRYSEYLHVPEQWQRDFSALRSSNELFQWVAEAAYAVLIVGAVAALIAALRRRSIPWRALILLCGSLGALTMLNEINTLPFFVDGMPTSTPHHEMVMFGLLQALGVGVGTFFFVILAGAPGEPLYRRSQPQHLALSALVSRRALRSKEFFLACATGYGFASAHIAFVVAFYLVGRRLGAWSPQDISYSDLLSTAVPWLYPLTISLLASFSEEFWFRLLAVPLLKRFLGSTWLAVVIPAFVWGFLHSNYPQQPGFVRGIEVGVIGVAAGFLMLRFGIVATLIWHYTVDAVFIGMFLFESQIWYFRLSGILVAGAILLPVAVSLFLYKRRGGFEADPALLNASDPVRNLPETAAPPRPEGSAGSRWSVRWLYFGALLALLLGLLARPFQFGDFVSLRLTREQAAAIADQAMKSQKSDPAAWRRVADFAPNLNVADFEYLRRHGGSRIANEIVRDRTFTGLWRVRYLRPLQSEEWVVFVNQQGRAYRMDHVLDEKAHGARLSPEEARRTAEVFLFQAEGTPVESYRLVDSNLEKLDNRTDHAFVWEDGGFRVAGATARVSVSVVGDHPSQYRRFLKLPEDWLRDFSRPRLKSVIMPALGGAIGLPLLIVAIRRLSSRHLDTRHVFRWRTYVMAASLAALFAALSAANEWAVVLTAYDTSKPLSNFFQQALLGRTVAVLLSGAGFFLLALVADISLQLSVGFRRPSQPSIARAVAVAVLAAGATRALSFAAQLPPGDRTQLPLWSILSPDSYLPALSILHHGFVSAAALLCVVLILSAAAGCYLRGWYCHAGVVSIVALAAVSRSTTPLQWTAHFLEGMVVAGLVLLLIKTCGLDLVSFGVAAFWWQTLNLSITHVEQPAAWLRWNGIASIAIAAVLGLLVIWNHRRRWGHSSSSLADLR